MPAPALPAACVVNRASVWPPTHDRPVHITGCCVIPGLTHSRPAHTAGCCTVVGPTHNRPANTATCLCTGVHTQYVLQCTDPSRVGAAFAALLLCGCIQGVCARLLLRTPCRAVAHLATYAVYCTAVLHMPDQACMWWCHRSQQHCQTCGMQGAMYMCSHMVALLLAMSLLQHAQ
jgi:hypothetical protein